MLCFLWFEGYNAEQAKILHYKFCQLPVGLKPSSALFYRNTLHSVTAEPEVYKFLLQPFNVDDFIDGITNEEGGIQLYQAAR